LLGAISCYRNVTFTGVSQVSKMSGHPGLPQRYERRSLSALSPPALLPSTPSKRPERQVEPLNLKNLPDGDGNGVTHYSPTTVTALTLESSRIAEQTSPRVAPNISRPLSPALPSEFLSAYEAPDAAADSPESLTTVLSVHGRSVRELRTAVGVVLCEIFFEREVYPRSIFRAASRFGLPTHRLGSTHTGIDADCAAQLSDALAQIGLAEELLVSGPEMLVVDLVRTDSIVVERWELDVALEATDGARVEGSVATASSDADYLRAQIGVLLRQISRSACFLPPLSDLNDGQPVVRIEAVRKRRRAAQEEPEEQQRPTLSSDDECDEASEAILGRPRSSLHHTACSSTEQGVSVTPHPMASVETAAVPRTWPRAWSLVTVPPLMVAVASLVISGAMLSLARRRA
jgi:hypothetical protein